MTLAIVASLLVLATRAAAGHPHDGNLDAPTRDDTLDLERERDADEPRELRTFEGAVVDRAEAVDMLERGDHERLPLVEPAPAVGPSWLGRLDVSIAWRRHVEAPARSLVEMPATVDQLWILASWSR